VRAAVFCAHLERLVVGVAAEFAGSHFGYPFVWVRWLYPRSCKVAKLRRCE
jgi:hypothetical protein